MDIVIDQDACIGAGQCVMTAPEVFDQNDDDGRALVLPDAPVASHVEAVRAAAATCPTAALRVTD